jgi:hypothetical protein
VLVAVLLLLSAHVGQLTVVAKSKDRDRKTVTQPHEDGAPLRLQVTPRAALAGTFVQALVRVHPHADNRLLRLTVESPSYFRSSDVTLNGADAAVSHFVPLRALPAGSYAVVAVVYGVDGERARSLQILELRSPHESN